MIKFKFVMGGVIAASLLEVNAFTVQDIVGDSGVDAIDRAYWSRADALSEDLYFDFASDTPPGSSHQIRLEPVKLATGTVRNDRVKVVGLTRFDGLARDFVFILADENNEPTSDGTRLVLENNNYANRSVTASNQLGDCILTAGYRTSGEMLEYAMYTFGAKSSYGTCYMPYWVGEISTGANGEIVVDFDDPAAFLPYGSVTSQTFKGSLINTNAEKIIDHYHIEVLKPNAYMSGSVYPSTATSLAALSFGSAQAHDPFPAKVTFDSDGTFSVVNLTGDGYAMYQTGDRMRHAYTGIRGGFDLTTGEAWLTGGEDAQILSWTWGSYQHRTNVRFGRVANVDPATGAFDFNDVKGTAEVRDGLHHRVPQTHWVTNGGTCRTFAESVAMTFPPFAYVYYSYIESMNLEQMQSSPAYSGSTLEVEAADVTLGTDLTIDVLGKSDTHIRVEATLDELRNTGYVDAYELWMVPGKHSYGDVNTAPFNHDNGHENAVLLQRIPADNMARTSTRQFNTVVAKSSLDASSIDPDDEYSFFVKAHYKSATGLAPTFHNLVSEPRVVTSIDDVTGDCAAVTVEGGAGEIVVRGAGGSVEVYTASGAVVYSGTDSRIPVVPGIYVVKAGGRAAKVAVR